MQKILYGVGALILLLILLGFALPRSHSVEVVQEIDAHPATIFALVNDFRRFSLWAPLTETDPNVRILYSGNPRGTGATMTCVRTPASDIWRSASSRIDGEEARGSSARESSGSSVVIDMATRAPVVPASKASVARARRAKRSTSRVTRWLLVTAIAG